MKMIKNVLAFIFAVLSIFLFVCVCAAAGMILLQLVLGVASLLSIAVTDALCPDLLETEEKHEPL